MLQIGEFSKIAQVSIKTLRYYDRMGLLKPIHIDRFSGYRYYSLSQLVMLNRILALKDLDFSLDQIGELLTLDLPEATMQNMLHNKAEELRQRIGNEQLRLIRVENRLKNLEDAVNPTHSPIVMKSAPHYLVATVRQVLPTISELPEWQEENLTLVHRYLDHLKHRPSGPDLLIYHQDAYCETDVDVEVGTIIREAKNNAEKEHGQAPIQIHTLGGVNQLATTVTPQTTAPNSETYAGLAQWIMANGFRPIGSWRELIYQQTEPISTRVIEVQRPVMRAIDFYQQLEVKTMEPKIMTKPGFSMVGLRYFGKNEHGEIPELWNKFDSQMKELGGIPNVTEGAIGLCTTPDNDSPEGAFEYVAGVPVTKVEDVPNGFVVRSVPEQTYAVFAHKGDMPSLGKTYEYIYESWLPQSGYQLASRMDFEYYNEDFKDFAPDSVFYIYIPIVKD